MSTQYMDENNKWGIINADRWNAFYNWLYENKIIDTKIEENKGFTNKYLEN